MKAKFQLGDSVFDVDDDTLEFSLTEPERGFRQLSIEVEAVADQVDKDAEWNWSGYPPMFYLRDFSLPDFIPGSTHELAVPVKHDEYEMALYLGEHNDVSDVLLRITAWNSVEISGAVDAMGTIARFHIRFFIR
jgi:hypothetical protein